MIPLKHMILVAMNLLLLVSAVLILFISMRLSRSIELSRVRPVPSPSDETPSVSVCIPARNEMHAMAECLERVLASDYRKLEIVVFDDDSGDTTSQIIRSFAQAGVRFVAGTGHPDGWLGKNYALDVLSREASGTYVLFMDVDTIISPTTISRLVDQAMSENAKMTSVIPERADGWRLSVLLGHLRYFWEIVASSRSQPAAASALWMINRHVLLKDLGGLEPFKSVAAPESAVAALLDADEYRCFISSPELEVLYEKKWSSQVETSKRLLYPRAGGTILGATMALAVLLLLNLPTFTVLSGFFVGWSWLHVTAAFVLGAGMTMYGIYTYALWRRVWLVGALCWPLVIFQELILLINSLQGYSRRTITWKGRPVSPSFRPTEL